MFFLIITESPQGIRSCATAPAYPVPCGSTVTLWEANPLGDRAPEILRPEAVFPQGAP